MSTISTHVLDTSLGRPAAGVPILLERGREPAADARNTTLGAGTTDGDGRLRDFISAGAELSEGTYRLRFDVGAYFAQTSRESFYPEVIVTFEVRATNEHYHVPLLISPFGYSTYRGS